MKTRPKKSTSAVNTSKIKEKIQRKPLSDKTNDAKTLNNMKRKKNDKQPTPVTSKVETRQTRKIKVNNQQSGTKNKVALSLDENNSINNKLKTRNARKPKNKTVANGTKLDVKLKKTDEQKNTKNVENSINPSNELSARRRSSRFSGEPKIKATLKSNKDVPKSNKDTSKSIKSASKSNKSASKSTDKINNSLNKQNEEKKKSLNLENSTKVQNQSSRFSNKLRINVTSKSDKNTTNSQQTNKINTSTTKQRNELKTPLKTKRLLDCLKSPSPENSDPYEFKFDPKKEPKRKPKKRVKPKKYDTTSDTSDEENNSMKPIVKNIRKKIENKQKISMTPVERKLRNRLVKIDRQAGLVAPEIKTKTIVKIPENTDIIKINPIVKDTSVADEINDIVNTFLEDDNDCFNNDSNVSISTPSRIDIISNLIARKSINKKSSANVFNSTMIHETPQQQQQHQQQLSIEQSPWRVEISAIPRKTLSFSVKNKSFTPSYTRDIITDNKKQSTLLGFVNRTPKTNLQVSLFESSPPRKPFENLSNSMSPISVNRLSISPVKRSNDSLFGFTVLSDSEDKENSPVLPKKMKSKEKQNVKQVEKKQTQQNDVNAKINEPVIDDISIPLFEDLDDVKRNEKRYSRQYTRPQTKRKKNISFNIDSGDESEDEIETHHVRKKHKDVLSKEEAEEAERLASHYNSYFDEIENYPLCIE